MTEPPSHPDKPQTSRDPSVVRPSTPKLLWEKLSTGVLVRFLLLFASGWAFVELIDYFESVIFTFAVSAVLAFLLQYPVTYLERFLGRGIALGTVILLTLLAIVTVVIGLGLTISAQLQQIVNVVIQELNSSDNIGAQLEAFLAARRIDLNLEPIAAQIRELLTSGASIIATSLPLLFGGFFRFVFIIVIAFFMLTDGERLWQLLLKLVPGHQRDRFAAAVEKNFLGFVQGQLVVSSLLSLATLTVFWILGIPFALALSIIVGVFDLIPGIGATLGVMLVCLIILVQSGWLSMVKVLAICVILQQIQDNFLSPRIMKNTVNLNPVIIFLALLVGGRIAGIIGVFLSIPIAGTVVSLLEIEEMQSKE